MINHSHTWIKPGTSFLWHFLKIFCNQFYYRLLSIKKAKPNTAQKAKPSCLAISDVYLFVKTIKKQFILKNIQQNIKKLFEEKRKTP